MCHRLLTNFEDVVIISFNKLKLKVIFILVFEIKFSAVHRVSIIIA